MPSVGGLPKGQVPGGLFWLFNTLSAIMSALAIVALARHAFIAWSLSAPMALIMDAYNAAMRLLLGWAHPYLQVALTWLGSFLGWRPTLYAHWRDAWVLTALFWSGILRAVLPGEPGLARLAVVSISALAPSLCAGTQPLWSDDLATQQLIASSFGAIGGIVLIWSGIPDRDGFMTTWAAGVWFFMSFPALATWLLSLAFGRVAGIGLAGMAVGPILLGLALPFLDFGARSSWIFASTALTGFLGAFAFFAIDAGLKLVMG